MQESESLVPFKNYFPNLSLNSYFWLVIFVSAIIFGILGYFVGIRVNELPSSANQQAGVPLPTTNATPGDDNDVDFSIIRGSFVTNTSYYHQLAINVDSIKDGVKTNGDTDYRDITSPQPNIRYPYSFSRLDPMKTYAVSASACSTDPKTFALICAKNIKIISCSGKIEGSTCIITGNGDPTQSSGGVNFSLTK